MDALFRHRLNINPIDQYGGHSVQKQDECRGSSTALQHQSQQVKEDREDDSSNDVGDEISKLYISTPLQQNLKRQLTDAESGDFNKRSRTTDRLKQQLSSQPSSPEWLEQSYFSWEHTLTRKYNGKEFLGNVDLVFIR